MVLGSQVAFSWNHSVWEILSKWLPTHHIILSLTCSKLRNDGNEEDEVDNRSENLILLTLWRTPSQLQISLLPRTMSGTELCHIITAGLLPRQFQNSRHRRGFYGEEFSQKCRHFAGTETSASEKAECLLARGADKKRNLFGETLSCRGAETISCLYRDA